MKKPIVIITLLAIVISVFSSCGKKTSSVDSNSASKFEYENTKGDDLCLISVDDNTLYTVRYDETGNAIVCSYGEGGSKTKEIPTDIQTYNISCFCVSGSGLYFAVEDTVICLDHNGDTVREYNSEEINLYSKIKIADGKIYFLGFGNDINNVEPFTAKSGLQVIYEDKGQVIGTYDISTGENNIFDIENPAAFSLNENGAVIYAFDSEGGYYFCEERSADKKMYVSNTDDSVFLRTFDMIDNDRFVYGDAGHLLISSITEGSGSVVISQDLLVFSSNEICTSGNNAYVIHTIDNGPARMVERFDCSKVEISDKPIRAIFCEYTELPRAVGDEVLNTRLSSEEFALKVLSLDHDFDVALIKSSEAVADSVKKLGGFYPLNDLQGVVNYSEKCFPNIQKAIRETNGDIKLLPICFDVPAIVLNRNNCEKKGITFDTSWNNYLSMLESNSENSKDFMSLEYNIRDNIFMQQIYNRGSFDTNEFAELAESLKRLHNSDFLKANFELYNDLITEMTMPYEEYQRKVSESFLFSLESQFISQQSFIGNKISITAASVPVTEGGAYGGICTFLCVNPYSDRLEEALRYAERTAEFLSEQNNSFLLADTNKYSDDEFTQRLYKVYSNAEVFINVPSEIYWDDFDMYLNGEMSVEQYIDEADRKLKVYLNE